MLINKTMTNFLPDNYSIPKQPSRYLKFEEGLNSIRILGSAIIGFEYWNTDNKPVRSKTNWEDMPKNIKPNKDGSLSIKHFWAFPVWNYNEKRVQILEVTQGTIQKALKALVNNPKWGDPTSYDIAITRIEEAITSYNVQGEPPISEPSDEIKEAYSKVKINLDALYEGQDPFAVKDTQATEDTNEPPDCLKPEAEQEINVDDLPL